MGKYFTYDPENNEFETHPTLEEQSDAAEDLIKDCLDNNDKWQEEVT